MSDDQDFDNSWEIRTGAEWEKHVFPKRKPFMCVLGIHNPRSRVFRMGGRDNEHYRCPGCGAAGGPL